MAIVYRTSGPWGPGIAEDLSAEQVDGNFHGLDLRVTEFEDNPPDAVSIANVTSTGSTFTVHHAMRRLQLGDLHEFHQAAIDAVVDEDVVAIAADQLDAGEERHGIGDQAAARFAFQLRLAAGAEATRDGLSNGVEEDFERAALAVGIVGGKSAADVELRQRDPCSGGDPRGGLDVADIGLGIAGL